MRKEEKLDKKTAALHNLGCKVNAYETEAMQQLLEEAGYEIVPFSDPADVYVINTCSVTNIADRKSRQMIHRARKQNPDAIVVAAGCYVQTSMEKAKEDLAIDIIIGNNKKGELITLIDEFRASHSGETEPEKVTDWVDINRETVSYEELSIDHTADHTRAFIKVQDGCNQFCTYCIIPYARGRVRSRALPEVVEEVSALAKDGYQEVVLTGIHLSSYGVGTDYGLAELIEAVHGINGIKRIRLGSLEPQIVTEAFVKRMAALPKLCPHFHLSLQSGCDTVLKRMNRKYDTAAYKKSCELLRTYFDHPAITTDVIVGFPGETEEEFAVTRQFLWDIHFYEMHVFKYSRRKGTVADKMPDQIDEQVKTHRSGILLEMERTMSEEFRRAYLGKEVEVLLEEPCILDGVRYMTGYTKEYVKVAIRTEEDLSNHMITGKITGQLGPDLLFIG